MVELKQQDMDYQNQMGPFLLPWVAESYFMNQRKLVMRNLENFIEVLVPKLTLKILIYQRIQKIS